MSSSGHQEPRGRAKKHLLCQVTLEAIRIFNNHTFFLLPQSFNGNPLDANPSQSYSDLFESRSAFPLSQAPSFNPLEANLSRSERMSMNLNGQVSTNSLQSKLQTKPVAPTTQMTTRSQTRPGPVPQQNLSKNSVLKYTDSASSEVPLVNPKIPESTGIPVTNPRMNMNMPPVVNSQMTHMMNYPETNQVQQQWMQEAPTQKPYVPTQQPVQSIPPIRPTESKFIKKKNWR